MYTTNSLEGTVPVASLIRRAEMNIIRSSWVLDCVKQTESDRDRPSMLLPLEPKHMFFTKEDCKELIQSNIDEYGDSYTRDVTAEELRQILEDMPKTEHLSDAQQLREQFDDQHHEFGELASWMFENTLIYADLDGSHSQVDGLDLIEQSRETAESQLRMKQACNTARFAGARFTEDFEDLNITHVLVNDNGLDRVKAFRKAVST